MMSPSVLWIAGAIAVPAALLSACGGGPAPDSATPEVIVSVTPPASAKLSVDEVIELAREAEALVDPETLQETKVELEPSGLVWKVSFKGLFYERDSTPSPEGTPAARERVCTIVTVYINDIWGQVDEVVFSRADSCS